MRADAAGQLTIPDSALRIRYYHQDHLGSSSYVSDALGAPVEQDSFYPFGQVRYEDLQRQGREDYRFSQKERDSESGLQYFEKRFAASSIAKFTRVDPISALPLKERLASPQTLNSYACCGANPIRFSDPSGMVEEDTVKPSPQSTFWGRPYYAHAFFVGINNASDLPGKNGQMSSPQLIEYRIRTLGWDPKDTVIIYSYAEDAYRGHSGFKQFLSTIYQGLHVGMKELGFAGPSADAQKYRGAYFGSVACQSGGCPEAYRAQAELGIEWGGIQSFGSPTGLSGGTQILGPVKHLYPGQEFKGTLTDIFVRGVLPGPVSFGDNQFGSAAGGRSQQGLLGWRFDVRIPLPTFSRKNE